MTAIQHKTIFVTEDGIHHETILKARAHVGTMTLIEANATDPAEELGDEAGRRRALMWVVTNRASVMAVLKRIDKPERDRSDTTS